MEHTVDEQQSRLLTWMAGALAVLIGALVFIDPPEGTGESDDDQTWTPLHENISTDKIAAMTLTSGEGTTAVSKEAGVWTITAPDPLPADQEAVTNIAREIAGIMCGEAISETPEPQFGLEPPQLVADITLEDGTAVSLRVGRDAPIGWSSYVVCGQDDKVRPTKSKLSTLRFTRDQLRSQVIFPTNSVPQSISLTTRTEDGSPHTTALERRSDGWYLSDGRRAAPNRIKNLFDALTQLKPTTLDAPPLDEVHTEITVRTEEGEVTIKQSRNGSIRTSEQPTPVTTDTELETLLPETAMLLADRPFTIEPTSISITKNGVEQTAQLGESGWDQAWGQTILNAKMDRTLFSAAPPAGDNVIATIKATDPLAGEQQIEVVSAAEQLLFRDGAGATEHPLPDEVGKIIQSL